MNQKQFRYAMVRGLGRCIFALKKDPERYRSQVLYACTHPTAYDTQSEGTRAGYTADMIDCYPDPTPFLNAAAACFVRPGCTGNSFSYFAELLGYFREIPWVETLLNKKYEALYHALMGRKRTPKQYDHQSDDLEFLAIVLAERKKDLIRITADLCKLYRSVPTLLGRFDWFCSRFIEELEALEDIGDSDAFYFLDAHRQARKKAELLREKQRTSPEYQEAKEKMRREIDLFENGGFSESIGDLVRDYTPAREAELLDRFKAIPVRRRGSDDWHDAGLDIRHLYDRFPDDPPSPALLIHLYETTLCSFCRAEAVHTLHRMGKLPEQILSEVIFDSNDEIRPLAEAQDP